MSALNDLYHAVQRHNWVVLDTETTGLNFPAEICQIAIINKHGDTLLNSLVKPKLGISNDASRVHGITDLHVTESPTWAEVQPKVVELLRGKDVIVYNAAFDRKMLHFSDQVSGLPHCEYKEFSTWVCAMEAYAEFWGEKHPYYGSYRWQKLTAAMEQQGEMETDAHSAWGDCCMAQWLTVHMAHVYHDRLSFNQLTGKDTGPTPIK